MADSPALNANSRRVLISLLQDAPPAPPPTVDLPPPKVNHPEEAQDTSEEPSAEADGEGSEEDDDSSPERPLGSDPYANLDGAFGKYATDEPKPGKDVRQTDDDDLLF